MSLALVPWMLRQLKTVRAGGSRIARDGQGGTRAVSRDDLESQRAAGPGPPQEAWRMAGTSWGSYALLDPRHPTTRSKRVNTQTRQPCPAGVTGQTWGMPGAKAETDTEKQGVVTRDQSAEEIDR